MPCTARTALHSLKSSTTESEALLLICVSVSYVEPSFSGGIASQKAGLFLNFLAKTTFELPGAWLKQIEVHRTEYKVSLCCW